MSAATSSFPTTRVAALAGRRIDAGNAATARFPLDKSDDVRKALRQLMQEEDLGLLVCSAACGSDLLALDAALELGIRCRVVIPYDQAEFKRTSVTDRPGNWGPLFDRLIAIVAHDRNLIVLGCAPGDALAYTLANEALVRHASDAAAPEHALAILVWEGNPRAGEDATAEFRRLAIKAGMLERTVITCSA